MFQKKVLILSIVFICISFFSLSSCKSSSSSDGGGSSLSINAKASIPSSLAVASNAETSASKRNSQGYDYASKVKAIQSVLSATNIADCTKAINLDFSMGPNVSCYGPEVFYRYHTDDSNTPPQCHDHQIVPSPTNNMECRMPTGDVGLWTASQDFDGTTMACSAAKLNSLVRQAGSYINFGMGVGAMTVCAANINNITMPDTSENVDLTTVAGSAISAGTVTMTVSSAGIKRAPADTTDGRPVFTISVSGTYTPNGESTAKDFSLTLKHIPKNDDNTEYSGLLTFESDPLGNQPENANQKIVASVKYGVANNTLTYRMRTGDFCESTSSYYGSNGEVTQFGNTNGDQGNCSDFQKNGWIGNFNESITSISTTDGYGKLAYGWQAGQGDGWLRTLNIETKSDGTGAAYFGFTENNGDAANTSNARTDGDLNIDGMWCNWAGPGNQKSPSQMPLYVQKQVLSKGTNGAWISTQDNIAFAPTNSCSIPNGLTYVMQFGIDVTEFNQDWSSGYNHSLASISSDYNFTVPTVPTLPE